MAPSGNEKPETILVNYKGANQESVSAGPRDLVRLNPGVNTVDKATWERIIAAAETERKSNKSKSKGGILFLMENDLVAEVPAMGAVASDEEPGGGLVDVTKMNVKEGIEVVNGEADLGNLNTFLAAEKGGQNRATLVKAIEDQIEKLNKAAEEAASGQDD